MAERSRPKDTPPCGVKRCRRRARQAFDVGSSWEWCAFRSSSQRVDERRHYEVCDKHAEEFFRDGGFIDVDRSERIKREVVAA